MSAKDHGGAPKDNGAVIDHVAEGTDQPQADPDATVRSPKTQTGLPVEEQVRKEWTPNKGGLPTF